VGGLAPLYSVSSTSVYTVHQRVAERFRVGRVLLLGDAAHINNPSGGMGMNSGIHDAWVLCERLAAVLAGGPEALLDAYAEERRRAAVEAVQRDSASHYQALTLSDEAARRRRNRELAATASDVRLAREYMLRASMLLEAPRPRSRGAGVPASDSEPM
jgi:3-(3-hydroxy-phenyl)propionate hydroxylase